MWAYLLIGVVVVLFLMVGRSPFRLPTWRIGSAMGALFAFAGAGYALVRNMWPVALLLAVIGLWLATSARMPRKARAEKPKPPKEPRGRMTAAEARSILGVTESSTRAQIQAAYTRLMKRAHPDHGGSEGLASQLNAARDRLLKD